MDINFQSNHFTEKSRTQQIRFVESDEGDRSQKNQGNIENPILLFGINELIEDIATARIEDLSEDINDEDEKNIKRVKQSLIWFWLTVVASLITGTENLYIFLGTMPYRDVIFTTPTLFFRIIFFPCATYNLCQNGKVIRRLYFMLDKIMMSAILVYLGVLGFILIFLSFTPSPWFYQSLFILFPVLWFGYTGHFRVMMVYCEWEKWQVIVFKVTLLIGAVSYFVLGIYYLVNQLRFTRGLSPELDNTIQNLLLIFINSGFQCYLEMFSKMDSIDGTSDFKMDYTLHCDPEDMQILLHGNKNKGDKQEGHGEHEQPSSLNSSITSSLTLTSHKFSRMSENSRYRVEEDY